MRLRNGRKTDDVDEPSAATETHDAKPASKLAGTAIPLVFIVGDSMLHCITSDVSKISLCKVCVDLC